MDDVEGELSPIGAVAEGLSDFLDETAESQAGGWIRVQTLRVALPVELYARVDPNEPGRVAALEGASPLSTHTSFEPVLHGFSLVVEVEGAEQREPILES